MTLKTSIRRRKNRQGFSLIELLVATAIAGVILFFVASPFLSAKKSDAESRIKAELDVLAKQVRQSILQDPQTCRLNFQGRKAIDGYARSSETADAIQIFTGVGQPRALLPTALVRPNLAVASSTLTKVTFQKKLSLSGGFGVFELKMVAAAPSTPTKEISRSVLFNLQEKKATTGLEVATCSPFNIFDPNAPSPATCTGTDRVWDPIQQDCVSRWYPVAVHAPPGVTATCPTLPSVTNFVLKSCECPHNHMIKKYVDTPTSVQIFEKTSDSVFPYKTKVTRNYATTSGIVAKDFPADIALPQPDTAAKTCECLWPVDYPATWAAASAAAYPQPSYCSTSSTPLDCLGNTVANCNYDKQQLFGWGP